MSTSVTLPALGESVTEGTVTRWLKQVGEPVEADEPLLEVSTDKVDTDPLSHLRGAAGDQGPGGRDRRGRRGAGGHRGRGEAGGEAPAAATPAEPLRPGARARDERRAGSARAEPGKAAEQDPEAGHDQARQRSRRWRGGAAGHRGDSCPRSARASPRARSVAGSSRSATPSRSTSPCWRSRPTRSTPRSPPPSRGPCSRSGSRRTRPSRSVLCSPSSASRRAAPAAAEAAPDPNRSLGAAST